MIPPDLDVDAVIIGAGFSGLYALHHLRDALGLSARAFDAAGGVGGTWWYNRYPGARVDAPASPYYAYTFSQELVDEWDWDETQTSQPAVLAYLEHFADRHDLRKDITLDTTVTDARYRENTQSWTVETATGELVSCRYLICALGALFVAHRPDYPGIDDFAGDCHHTGRWPHEPIDFTGKRVGVIGTGSSGIQVIPEIAKTASHVTVFQRTPQYTLPARNRSIEAAELDAARANWEASRAMMASHPAGQPYPTIRRSAFDDTPEVREALFEELWELGGPDMLMRSYSDLLVDKAANDTIADFVRKKIREIVDDLEVAEKLLPSYYLGTKRLILDNGYYETYNRDNITLVDLRDDPIERFTSSSAHTTSGEHEIDILVLATGFDAVTGSMMRLNPKGRGGLPLREKWGERFDTQLGLTIAGFPNLFMMHGPGSPGVFFAMPMGAELQGKWIGECIDFVHESGFGSVEATVPGEQAWDREIHDLADRTLYPLTDSWYTGANVPGKPRQFLGHLSGPRYYRRLAEVAENSYSDFIFEKAHSS